MSYIEWFKSHGEKHANLLKKLKGARAKESEIVDYFRWDNLSKKEPNFCMLFGELKKCHNTEELNCYLCACPHFRFNDDAKKIISYCIIDSAQGAQIEINSKLHQDCGNCQVPHNSAFIKRHFNENWFEIMHECDNNETTS